MAGKKRLEFLRSRVLKRPAGKLPVFLLAVFLVVSAGILVLSRLWGGVSQPFAFNHKIHGENGLECLDCHQNYEDRASSGKPALSLCAGCHEEPVGESANEKKLAERIRSGQEIAWQRLYRVPEDVYFSHKRHVVLGKMECRECHGDIGERAKPPSRPLVKITMKRCMGCHEQRGVVNDCIACHR
jgi:hypothetical protein